MLKRVGFKIIPLISLLTFTLPAVCLPSTGRSEWLVSPKLLEHARLEKVWATGLPLRQGERLDRLVVIGNRIYAVSDQNHLISLNREKGDFVFRTSLAPARFTVLGLQVHKDRLLSLVGNSLVEINPESGTVLSTKHLGFGVTCPVARNDSYLYVASAGRRLRTYRAEDNVLLFEAAAENDSMITAVVADNNSVVFATDAGNVISITPDKPKRRWEFNAADGIVGPMARDAESLFIASRDTYVYKLNIETGTPPVWKYQTGAILEQAPQVTADVVYQPVHDKGLTAIDKESGTFLWQVDKGLDLLAEADGKAYVFRRPGELVVMDNAGRRQLYSVNLAEVSRYAVNLTDLKIYVADEIGRILCLSPLD
ncbi:MAG: outer membrane protein assembly factor BamB family protein [Planctomycetota bacterium]|jgi:outer membrane protein assembly factor BamB